MNKEISLITLIFVLFQSLCAQDLDSDKNLIKQTVELQLKQRDDKLNWLEEKIAIQSEIKAAEMKKEELAKEIESLKKEVQIIQTSIQTEKAEKETIEAQYRKAQDEMFQSYQSLSELKPVIQPNKDAALLIESAMDSIKTSDKVHLGNDFDRLLNVHLQIWQMGQTFSINDGTINIEDKKYHGKIIRLGLIFNFCLFSNQNNWARYEKETQKWVHGDPKDLNKIIDIYKVLAKKTPAEIISLPGGTK